MDLAIPATLTIGVAYKPQPETTVELDLEWTQWSAVEEFFTKYTKETDATRLLILNTNNPDAKDWDDTWNIALGVEHIVNEKYTVYGGTRYLPSAMPEATYNPAIPTTDQFSIHGGFTTKLNERSRLDFGGAYCWFLAEDITNTVGQSFGASIDGNHKGNVLVLLATYTHTY